MANSMSAVKKFAQKSDRQEPSMTLPLFDGRSVVEKLIANQPPLNPVEVYAKPNLTAALEMCFRNAELDDKAAASLMGIDGGQFSRILSGTAHFPTNRYVEFMEKMGNDAPLMWLANSRGYELRPLRSELEQQLEAERVRATELERQNALMRELLTGRRA